jgi:hypothetical protein
MNLGGPICFLAVATAIAVVIPVTRYKRNGTVELTEYVFDPPHATSSYATILPS